MDPFEAFKAFLQKHQLRVGIPDCCGPGWLPILEEAVVKMKALGWDGYIGQVKEKFGGLRFYVDATGAVPEDKADEFFAIRREAEKKSWHVCEICGEAGKYRGSLGWKKTLCEAHYIEADAHEAKYRLR